MFLIFLYIIVLILILYYIHFEWKYRSLRKVKGPPGWPILGVLLEVPEISKLFEQTIGYFNNYGKIVKLPVGKEMIILTIDKEMCEFFLRSPKHITKAIQYDFLDPWLKKGILNSNGTQWQIIRKTVTPAFHFKILVEQIKYFDAACDIFIEVLNEQIIHNEKIDIFPLVTNFTLDIITETAMGININCQKVPKKEFLDAMHDMLKIPFERTFSLWKWSDFLYKFSKTYAKQQEVVKILDDMTFKIIAERKKYLLENKDKINENSKQSIFLDILLNTKIEGKPLPDDVLIREVNNFMFGGHDTTASSISFLLHALANYPEVQNKVLEEIEMIFGSDQNRKCTIEDLNEMKYLECVIKEVLRFYIVVSFVGRRLTEDTEYDGIVYPKGVSIFFFIYGMLKSPEYFKDPDVFNPDRFLDNSTIKAYTYIPFSAGPRNCLGQKYAMLEMKVTIARLIRHFEFVTAGPENKLVLIPGLLMTPTNGIVIGIKKRNYPQ